MGWYSGSGKFIAHDPYIGYKYEQVKYIGEDYMISPVYNMEMLGAPVPSYKGKLPSEYTGLSINTLMDMLFYEELKVDGRIIDGREGVIFKIRDLGKIGLKTEIIEVNKDPFDRIGILARAGKYGSVLVKKYDEPYIDGGADDSLVYTTPRYEIIKAGSFKDLLIRGHELIRDEEYRDNYLIVSKNRNTIMLNGKALKVDKDARTTDKILVVRLAEYIYRWSLHV